jgi:glutamate synthase (NADPH/NADH) large chain
MARSPREGQDQGLYDSQFEHDACGVGLVADLSGRRTHHTVAQALAVLRNLDHRGAKGSDPGTGDGAGILTQMPDALFRASCRFELPAPGSYAAGLVFLPEDPAACASAQAHVARLAAEEGPAGATCRTTRTSAAPARGPRRPARPSRRRGTA